MAVPFKLKLAFLLLAIVFVGILTYAAIDERRYSREVFEKGVVCGKLGMPAITNPYIYPYSTHWLDGYVKGLSERPKEVEPKILGVMELLK